MYLWWLTALAPYLCNAQNVYSVNVYASGVIYEKEWVIGSPPNQWGLSQYSQWEDSNGLVIINAGHEKELGGVQRRYTRIHLGSVRVLQNGSHPPTLSLRLPAGAVAVIIVFLAIMSIGVVAFALKNGLRKSKRQDVT